MLEGLSQAIEAIVIIIALVGALGGVGVVILFALPEDILGQYAGRLWASVEGSFWRGYHAERQEALEKSVFNSEDQND